MRRKRRRALNVLVRYRQIREGGRCLSLIDYYLISVLVDLTVLEAFDRTELILFYVIDRVQLTAALPPLTSHMSLP